MNACWPLHLLTTCNSVATPLSPWPWRPVRTLPVTGCSKKRHFAATKMTLWPVTCRFDYNVLPLFSSVHTHTHTHVYVAIGRACEKSQSGSVGFGKGKFNFVTFIAVVFVVVVIAFRLCLTVHFYWLVDAKKNNNSNKCTNKQQQSLWLAGQ